MTRMFVPALAAFLLSSASALAQAPSLPLAPAPEAAPPAPAETGALSLSAAFADQKPIRSGLVWRVFEDRGDAGQPVQVAKSSEAEATFSLPPGAYIVHAAYGFAGASKRVTVGTGGSAERVAISAGALRLAGAVADTPIPPNRVSFSVFVPIGNN